MRCAAEPAGSRGTMGRKRLEIADASDSEQTWARINVLLARIRKIEGDIAATGEPASQLEIAELKELGNEYAELVKRLEEAGDRSGG